MFVPIHRDYFRELGDHLKAGKIIPLDSIKELGLPSRTRAPCPRDVVQKSLSVSVETDRLTRNRRTGITISHTETKDPEAEFMDRMRVELAKDMYKEMCTREWTHGASASRVTKGRLDIDAGPTSAVRQEVEADINKHRFKTMTMEDSVMSPRDNLGRSGYARHLRDLRNELRMDLRTTRRVLEQDGSLSPWSLNNPRQKWGALGEGTHSHSMNMLKRTPIKTNIKPKVVTRLRIHSPKSQRSVVGPRRNEYLHATSSSGKSR